MSINNNEELLEIGNCPEHQRIYECFCLDCNVTICPSCLMFDQHKGHNVGRIEDACRDLRGRIDEVAKEGLLKAQNAENTLLDIRHTKLTCEEKKTSILNEIEQIFNQVMKQLKKRKEEITTQVTEHFDKEFTEIYNNEQKWVDNQEIAQELVNLMRNSSELQILNNSQYIIQGIQKLKEKQTYNNVSLINTIDSQLYTEEGKISLQQFLNNLKTFVRQGETINQQYKC